MDYRGGMITAEDATSSFNNTKIFPDNGVIVKNKSVGAMDVTYFDLDALPEFVNSTGAVMDYIGTGPKIVKLLKLLSKDAVLFFELKNVPMIFLLQLIQHYQKCKGGFLDLRGKGTVDVGMGNQSQICLK